MKFPGDNHLEARFLNFVFGLKCGFYSPITLIQSGQTNKQTHTHSHPSRSDRDRRTHYSIKVQLKHYVTVDDDVNYIIQNCNVNTPTDSYFYL